MIKKKAFNFRFYLAAVVLLAGGMLAAIYLDTVFVVVLSILLCVVFYAAFKKRRVFVLFFILGAIYLPIRYNLHSNKPARYENVTVSGIVDSAPEVRDGGAVWLYIRDVRVGKKRVFGRALIYTDADIAGEVNQGDRIGFFAFSFDKFKLGKSSYEAFYYNRRVYYSAHMNELTEFEKSRGLAERFRERVYKNMSANMSEEGASVAYTLMFGDTSGLDKVLSGQYKGAGMAHVFSVSGLHFGFLYTLLRRILKKVKIKAALKSGVMFGVFLIYGYLCGFSPPVMRSVIMMSILILAELLGRKPDTLNSLCFAAFVVLLINPFFILDIGFRLSFLSTAGIVLLYPVFIRFFGRVFKNHQNNRAFSYLVSAVSLTLAANIGSLPVICAAFKGMPLVSIPVNVLVLPIISILYPFLFIVSVVGIPLRFFSVFFVFADKAIGALNNIIGFFSGLSTSLSVSFGVVGIVFYYVILVYISRVYIGPRIGFKNRSAR